VVAAVVSRLRLRRGGSFGSALLNQQLLQRDSELRVDIGLA